MPEILDPGKALIFRITHRDNMPWIINHGLHAPNGQEFDPYHRNIGDLELISKRSTHAVRLGAGGMLSDYVPFYFTPFSPMMYNIHTGMKMPHVPNEEIVVMISSLHKVSELKIPFVFTDQHAFRRTAKYFTDLSDLGEVDWDLLNSRNFRNDPDDPGKNDRYQAEALVRRYVPLDALREICCYTSAVENYVNQLLAARSAQLKATIQRGWYF